MGDYTPEQFEKYRIDPDPMLQYAVGTIIKYVSLIVGISSLFNGEINYNLVSLMGFTYFLGELFKRDADRHTKIIPFSALEETLGDD